MFQKGNGFRVFLKPFGGRSRDNDGFAFRIQRYRASFRRGEREEHPGLLENIIGNGQGFEPQTRLIGCAAHLRMRSGYDQNFYRYHNFVVYRSSSMERLLFLSCLKCEGVRPVTFLNWVERCATLL